VSIILPWPPKELSPNYRSRSHWPKTRATKKARGWARLATLENKPEIPAEGDIRLVATCHPPTAHARDGDNLNASLKAYLDGIADALKVNDSRFKLQEPIFAEPVPKGKVIVSVVQ
jgi:hypothetical protein